MKTLLLILLLVPMMSIGQNVYIPDANFKAYLVGEPLINTNGDSEIQVSEASAFTGLIDCTYENISDLTGIETFTALTVLRCGYNQLTSLDVSNNTALTQFSCQDNQLTSLDVSSNTALTFFNCPNNQITSLDVFNNTALTFFNCPNNQITSLDVSNNTALTNLYCFSNQLTSLDVSGATALTDLNCGNNQLTSLDVSSNTALTDLTCYNNQLTSLDVSSNTALTDLNCGNNQLTSLDVFNNTALTVFNCGNNQLTSLDVFNNTALTFFNCPNNQITSLDVSNNTALTNLYCFSNQLTSLDVSNNIALTQFTCQDNQLTSLDVSSNTALTSLGCMDNDLNCLNVKNGNNTNVTNFNIYNNPNLTCVEVDDVNYAISSNMGTSLDPQMYFSTDCGNDCAACIPTSSIDTHTACDSFTWLDGNTYTASTNNPNPTVHTINAGSYYYLPSTLTINTGDAVEWINDGGFHDVNGETNTITGLPYNNPEVFNSPSTSVVGAVIYSHTFTVPGTYEYDCSVGQHAANGMVGTITVLSPPTYTIPNVAGCDSVITLDLTINYSNTGTDVITACDSYTWVDGNTYTSSNNTATWTETNAAGCDSLVTLDLTINNSSSSTDIVTACDSYSWVDGNTYTASNNSATWIETNAAGCDSIVTLDLTINSSNTGTDVITACDSYSWVDGNTYTASNNSATYTTINAEGCDSTITLDLTITPQSTSSIIKTACSFYIAPDDEVYTSTGNYTAIIDNAAGCDSVITIDLTINPTPSAAVTQNGATLTATQTGATYEWLDCDDESIIVGEINQAFTPTTTGSYAVIVTISDCFKKSECFLVDFTGIGELNNTPKQLIKIVDVLGRETPFKPNTPLLYIYNDGTVERKMIIKE